MSQADHELFEALNGMLVGLRATGIFDEGDPLLSQSFVEGETAVPEIIGDVIRSLDDDQVLVAGLTSMIDEYQKRKARIEKRMENKRGLIELTLMRADITSLETPAATVSLRPLPKALGPINEALIPSDYFSVPAPTLDRRKLLADLKDGKDVAGAVLSNGGVSLAIRRH